MLSGIANLSWTSALFGGNDEGMRSKELAEAYFKCWTDGDFDGLRNVLADDAAFRGPMGTANGAEDCATQLSRFAQHLDGVTIEKMLADDHDVLTWFNLHPKGGDPVPVVNWSHIEDGRIQRVRVTFDPRPLLD